MGGGRGTRYRSLLINDLAIHVPGSERGAGIRLPAASGWHLRKAGSTSHGSHESWSAFSELLPGQGRRSRARIGHPANAARSKPLTECIKQSSFI
jgi:hypothetical protein